MALESFITLPPDLPRGGPEEVKIDRTADSIPDTPVGLVGSGGEIEELHSA